MSNNNDAPVKPIPVPTEVPQDAEKKHNFVAKTKQFVKDHKTPTIAVGALVGLVGLAAVAGRRSEPLPGFQATLELEPPHVVVDAEIVENDTQSA